MLVTRRHYAVDVAVVISRILILQPTISIAFGDAVCIEQIGHAHHVLVVTARCEHHSFFVELPLRQLHNFPEALLNVLPVLVVHQDGILIDGKGGGFGIVKDIRVVSYPTELGTGLALGVGHCIQHPAVMGISPMERFFINQLLLCVGKVANHSYSIIKEQNTDTLTADGLIYHQGMLVLLCPFGQGIHLVGRQAVEIDHPNAGPTDNVFLGLATLEVGSHRETEARVLFIGSRFQQTLTLVITVLFGTVLDGRILANDAYYFLQCRFFGGSVVIIIENIYFHRS